MGVENRFQFNATAFNNVDYEIILNIIDSWRDKNFGYCDGDNSRRQGVVTLAFKDSRSKTLSPVAFIPGEYIEPPYNHRNRNPKNFRPNGSIILYGPSPELFLIHKKTIQELISKFTKS